MSTEESIAAWARREAAKLPPLTDQEARELGAIAARIDARRRAQQTDVQTGRAA